MKGRVLVVAGSDSGGGAGIQADIKTITALGGYAMTAITALTAQTTEGVFGIHEVPADFVSDQIRLVLRDLGADCVKIGMLHRPDVIDAVADALQAEASGVPVVVDPVMVAKGGHALLTPDAVVSLRRRIVSMADVLTPNIPEAETLVGESEIQGSALAERVLELGPTAVLLKGGHAEGPTVVDILVERRRDPYVLESPRITSTNTHGTGCTLASAIAVGFAQGLNVRAAVERARTYVQEAIRRAPGYGRGHGPLNHAFTVRSDIQ